MIWIFFIPNFTQIRLPDSHLIASTNKPPTAPPYCEWFPMSQVNKSMSWPVGVFLDSKNLNPAPLVWRNTAPEMQKTFTGTSRNWLEIFMAPCCHRKHKANNGYRLCTRFFLGGVLFAYWSTTLKHKGCWRVAWGFTAMLDLYLNHWSGLVVQNFVERLQYTGIGSLKQTSAGFC